MVCTAEHLLGWKDFPKGLRVLLLDDEGSVGTAEIKLKLEEMDYIVSTFCDVNTALMELSNKPESFHVAVVEVSTKNQDQCFKFLETAIDLPTIMTSNIQCISTMMKCIALGAAEFLQKPLSEDKLRNIWQHVVHKAFSSKANEDSKTPKTIKEENPFSMLQLKQEKKDVETQNFPEIEDSAYVADFDHEQSTVIDKYPAPSTPQLKQGCRFSNDRVYQDQTNSTVEKVSGDQEGESKSVDTTCNDSVAETILDKSCAEVTVMVEPSVVPNEGVVREDSLEGSKDGSSLLSHPLKKSRVDSNSEAGQSRRSSLHPNSSGKKSNRKMKVDWTPELHKRFVQAVEKLGVDQAIPSRILDLMKVEGLTRHNVASHLQKYRMNKRHIRPKDDDRRWQHPRDPMQRVYPQKPIMAYPPYHPNHGFPTNQFYHVWGHPSHHPSNIHMWGHPAYPTWHTPDNWSWNAHPGMHVDAFGRPLVPPYQGPYSNLPQYAPGYHSLHGFEDSSNIQKTSIDLHPAEEVIDKVVKEAISKPWLPLPLGLKPPSTESVLCELHRQGICNIPPPPHSSHM